MCPIHRYGRLHLFERRCLRFELPLQICNYANMQICKYANMQTKIRFNQNVIRCFPDRRSQARHGREVLENYWNPAQKEIRGLVINRRIPLPLSHLIRLVSTSAGNFLLAGCHVVLLSYCVLVRSFVNDNVWNGNVAEFGPLWHFEIHKDDNCFRNQDQDSFLRYWLNIMALIEITVLHQNFVSLLNYHFYTLYHLPCAPLTA